MSIFEIDVHVPVDGASVILGRRQGQQAVSYTDGKPDPNKFITNSAGQALYKYRDVACYGGDFTGPNGMTGVTLLLPVAEVPDHEPGTKVKLTGKTVHLVARAAQTGYGLAVTITADGVDVPGSGMPALSLPAKHGNEN